MQQFKLSLLLCLAFLLVLATGGAIIIVWTPRAGPDVTPSGGAAPSDAGSPGEAADERLPAGYASSTVAEEKILDERPAETDSAEAQSADVGLTPYSTEKEKPPVEGLPHAALSDGTGAAVEESGIAIGRQAPQRGPPESRRHAQDHWRIHSVSLRPRVFLLDGEDPGGARRLALPAPIDQRFLLVSLSLTWEGQRQRTIYFEDSSISSPTVQLATEAGVYDPIGRLADNLDPLAPLRTDYLIVGDGERVEFDVAFLLPSDLVSVSLVLDGQGGATVVLPPPIRAKTSELLGVWHRLSAPLQALRYDDPLINALADPSCRLLWITDDQAGTFRVHIPSADVISDDLAVREGTAFIRLELNRGTHRQPAWLRPIDGGSSLLLYVGDRSPATFMFGRSHRPP